MSPTKEVQCPVCHGRGKCIVYVNEWAELFERLSLWWRRLTGRES